MGVSAAVFESAGKRTEHYIPGVYSRSNNVTSASGVSSGNLCIMGKSTGGTPLELLEFSSISEAKNTLLSGNLLEGVAYAFNGSNDYVPQKVYAMRVNGGVQGTLTLSSGSTESIKLTAWDYGSHTNQLKLKIETGTIENSKKFTLVYKSTTKTVDNIIKKSIQVYGGGTNPTVTIGEDSMILSTTDDDSETVTETLSFEEFPTISELVAKINDSEYFTATQLDSDDDALSSELDTVTSVAISEGLILYSNFVAFVDELENIEYFDSVEVLTTATRVVPDNTSYVYFSGGSTSSYTTDDWSNALEALETKDIQIIATPCTTQEIQVLIANHCTSMSSTVNRKERMCWFGGELDEADDDLITKAKVFNNKLVSYVGDSVIASNPITGETENVNGALVACMLAGMESAMAVHIPLTNKVLKVLGFRTSRNITNLEKLIKNGIVTCNPNPDDNSDYVCIRAVTTYQQDDLISNERSMTREDLYMNRDLRQAYSSLIGTPNNVGASVFTQTLLAKAEEWANAGYIVRDDSNNAVWNTSVSIDGDKVYISFSRYLTAPTNFIFITATNYVYTSTVEV